MKVAVPGYWGRWLASLRPCGGIVDTPDGRVGGGIDVPAITTARPPDRATCGWYEHERAGLVAPLPMVIRPV